MGAPHDVRHASVTNGRIVTPSHRSILRVCLRSGLRATMRTRVQHTHLPKEDPAHARRLSLSQLLHPAGCPLRQSPTGPSCADLREKRGGSRRRLGTQSSQPPSRRGTFIPKLDPLRGRDSSAASHCRVVRTLFATATTVGHTPQAWRCLLRGNRRLPVARRDQLHSSMHGTRASSMVRQPPLCRTSVPLTRHVCTLRPPSNPLSVFTTLHRPSTMTPTSERNHVPSASTTGALSASRASVRTSWVHSRNAHNQSMDFRATRLRLPTTEPYNGKLRTIMGCATRSACLVRCMSQDHLIAY